MQDCLTLIHVTDHPFRENKDPEMDILESLSAWKSESIYSGIFKSLLENTSIYFLVVLRYMRIFSTAVQ